MDTLYFLIDGAPPVLRRPTDLTQVSLEIPIDSKTTTFDPFRLYPNTPFGSLSASIPPEFRAQLGTVLQQIPPDSNTIVSGLGLAHCESGHIVPSGLPVLNRPWEWVENLGVENEKEKDEKEKLGMRYLVKNSGSLSLETFGARITGDGVLRGFSHECAEGEGRIEGNVRTFEDGLNAEGVFKRDWRETRLETEVDARSASGSGSGRMKEDDDDDVQLALFSQGLTGRPVSPASSSRSRGSSQKTRRSMSTISEVESVTSSPKKVSVGKRKVVSDEEVQATEGHALPSTRTRKKAKTNSADKIRVKC
jgi:mediator of RNA polymerase II transcription subunit 12